LVLEVLAELEQRVGTGEVQALELRIATEEPESRGEARAVAGDFAAHDRDGRFEAGRRLRAHRLPDALLEQHHRERERQDRDEREAEDQAGAERVHGVPTSQRTRFANASAPPIAANSERSRGVTSTGQRIA
jgi:hypothetical protein